MFLSAKNKLFFCEQLQTMRLWNILVFFLKWKIHKKSPQAMNYYGDSALLRHKQIPLGREIGEPKER